MSLILQGSTSGSITLQEPAVAGTTVLTLPAVTGTILTTTSPKAGNVIQVVSATNSTSQSTTSTSFVNTSLSASITPTSSSSKVLILVTFMGYGVGGAGVNWVATITRGSTNLGNATWGMATIYNSAGGIQGGFAMSYLDSPATTSSTTYNMAYRKDGGTAYINFNGEQSSITLLEIAA